MKNLGKLLGYEIYLIESRSDCDDVLRTSPDSINYFAFDTEVELNNFINYLKTDFVRICLYLIKTTMHLANGELKYIPWFDFSDPVFSKSPTEIDDYLFAKYNISDEIRKHIEELLPDYYNIRKG